MTAAIETIAEVGYTKTSFAKIAKRARLSSTGMISYHFAGKEDLVGAVTEEVMRVATEFMQPRIRAAQGYTGMLRAYIEANVELLAHHPVHLRALLEILNNARNAAGEPVVDATTISRIGLLTAHLRDGQRAGEFAGFFDPGLMATAVSGAIDAVITSRPPGLDPAACGRELADTFARATRPCSENPDDPKDT